MASESKMMLVVEAGKSKGKKFVLKKTEYSLGSDRKSSIKLVGEFVSPLHAVIKQRDEGQWVIQNRSPNQTLVNNQVVDTKPLVVGDSIQIGASNLLRFDLVSKRDSKSKEIERGEGGSSALSALLQKPAVLAGLLVYGALIAFVFVFLSGKSTDKASADWSRDKIDEVIEGSVKQMFGDGYQELWDQDLEVSDGTTKNSHTLYDSIITLKGVESDEQLTQRMILTKALMLSVSEQLRNAWHFEQQGRWDEAIALYESTLELIPDIDLPVTRLIVERKRWAQQSKKRRS